MSRIPTVGMEKAYRELITTNKNIVSFYMAHTLEYSYNPNSDIEEIYYFHYDTHVATVYHNKTNDKYKVVLSPFGWSQTDAVNVTGLLRCIGINTVSCYRKNEELYLKVNGKKTELKEYVVEWLKWTQKKKIRI